MRLDLHIHTTASDGSWSPEAVVRGAAKGGLDVIAIADHDTTAAVSEAQRVGREVNVQVVAAIEVSSSFQGRDVHVLGYFVDLEAPALRDLERRAGGRREDRMREMLDRLREQGIDVPYAAVEAEAGPEGVVIGRPHLAKALVAAGHVSSVNEAFLRLIGDDHEAFVPMELLDPVGAVSLIGESGGVAMWAHPPGDLVDTLLPSMTKAGLRGLEVYRPRSKRAEVLRYESICKTAGLLMSGGSDWHSPEWGNALGDFHVTADEIEGLLEAGGL
ncbi:MAG: PHP domain-containing protein [Gemmatimonadetes bacterium]|nr:PHP domain-containing protein [Gemmatimonadota bacterium]